MAGSDPWPRVGNQPYNEGEHATQLLADVAALRSHRNTTQKRDKNPPWTIVNLMFESIEVFIKKSREQPSLKELQADLHTAEKANEILRKNVILIKNTLESTTGSFTPALGNGMQSKSYAKALKIPLQQPSPTIPKDRQIAVKVNNNDPISQARIATREQLIERINRAIGNSKNGDLSSSEATIRAVKTHPSGDLTLYTKCREHTECLIRHRTEWEKAIGPAAKVVVPTYGVLIHGISTELDTSNTKDIADRIIGNNSSLRMARITYTGWLKKDLVGKRASTMVVEFDNPQHADEAILNGLVLGAQLFTCEFYDRSCKLKQYFRCQRYGHIGTHCKAMETCSYCSGNHDSRKCEEKGKRPKPEPKCANCGGKHPAWSPHCATRKAAYLQLETARNCRPHTHKEAGIPYAAGLPSTAETPCQTDTLTGSSGKQVAMTDKEAFPTLPPANEPWRKRAASQKEIEKVTTQQPIAEKKRGRSVRKEGRLGSQKGTPASTATQLSSQLVTLQHSPTELVPFSQGTVRQSARTLVQNKRQAYETEAIGEQQTQDTTVSDVDMSE